MGVFRQTVPNAFAFGIIGSPCWARTSDTLINSQVLVPTELRRNIVVKRKEKQKSALEASHLLPSRLSAISPSCLVRQKLY